MREKIMPELKPGDWEPQENAKEGVDYFVVKDGIRRDIKEQDPKLKKLIELAGQEAEKILKESSPGCDKWLGYCHSVWGEQQRILKEKYGIDWKTPAELNPDICFD
jgi:hypothetical protein